MNTELPDRCSPCKEGTPALDLVQAAALHTEVPGWTLAFPRLRRSWVLPHFRKALAFVNRIGMLAEEEQHHPDFHITGWNQVSSAESRMIRSNSSSSPRE